MMDTSLQGERRRYQRVEIPEGYVHCTTGGKVSYYALSDLSAGGARLRGLKPLSPGMPVEVILFLPKFDTTSFDGTVRRVSRGEGARFFIGVEFDRLSAAQEERLIALIRREIRLSRGPVALVASPEESTEPALKAALRKEGYVIVEESTPLGVVTRLEDPTLPVEVVFLQSKLGTLPLPELLRFLRRIYPHLQLYAVGDFDENVWEEIYPLVEAILPPGTGHEALAPVLGWGTASPPALA